MLHFKELISSPTMAPETQHFTEIYCDKASRLSPSGDDPCVWDLCSPHRCIQQLQSSLLSPQEVHTRVYRRCVVLLHNHGHVIIIKHLGQMEYINIHATLQNMCHAYLTFHNSHNSHPYIQHIYQSGIAPHIECPSTKSLNIFISRFHRLTSR